MKISQRVHYKQICTDKAYDELVAELEKPDASALRGAWTQDICDRMTELYTLLLSVWWIPMPVCGSCAGWSLGASSGKQNCSPTRSRP